MSSNGSFRQDLFAQFARVGKVLSSNRLEMLDFLAQGGRSVEALTNVARTGTIVLSV